MSTKNEQQPVRTDDGPSVPGARVFRGRTLDEVLPDVRAALGDTAVVLRRREGLGGGVGGFFQKRFVEVEAIAGPSGGVDLLEDAPALPAGFAAAGPVDAPAFLRHLDAAIERRRTEAPDAGEAAGSPPSPWVVSAPGPEAVPVAAAGARRGAVAAYAAPTTAAAPADPPAPVALRGEAPAAVSPQLVTALRAAATVASRAVSSAAPVAGRVVPTARRAAAVDDPAASAARGVASLVAPATDTTVAAPGRPVVAWTPARATAPAPASDPELADDADDDVLLDAVQAAPVGPEASTVKAKGKGKKAAKRARKRREQALAESAEHDCAAPDPSPDAGRAPEPPADARDEPIGLAAILDAVPATVAAPSTVEADIAEYGLVARGLPADLARSVVAEAVAHVRPFEPGLRLDRATRTVLARRLAPQRVRDAVRAIAVVGGPGSGRTNAVGALATAYEAAGRSVLVVALGAQDGGASLRPRLAGTDAELLVTGSGASAAAAFAAGGLDVCLIDTPAVRDGDHAAAAALARELGDAGADEVHVAVPATATATEAARAIAALEGLGADAMLVTHRDRAERPAGVVGAAIEIGLPVSYLAGERSVAPGEPARVARLVQP